MKLRHLSALAAILLLGACAADPSTTDGTEAGGGTMTSSTMTSEPAGPSYREVMADPQQYFMQQVATDRVFFEFDSSELGPSARDTLERQAEWLQQYPVAVVIEGHADERGTREYNLALGERRANAAKDYLVSLGIPDSRISVVSYGKERPAVVGSNEYAWAQNRRAVTKVSARPGS